MDFNNPNDVQRYETVQYEAIKLLATLTKRWSDSVDIVQGSKYIRVTITYLSPELIYTIILNHYLFRKIGNVFNSSFEGQIASTIEELANRNEHIFFITLSASVYEQGSSPREPVIVYLPVESLVMTNSSNIQVTPQHDDHNLEERIDLTSAPAYGYISYPIAVSKVSNETENCELFLNKNTNTHLTVSVPYVEINGTRHQIRSWMLEYTPLLQISLNSNLSNSVLQVEKKTENFKPDITLPLPTSTEEAEYWEKIARFIWYETTLDP